MEGSVLPHDWDISYPNQNANLNAKKKGKQAGC